MESKIEEGMTLKDTAKIEVKRAKRVKPQVESELARTKKADFYRRINMGGK